MSIIRGKRSNSFTVIDNQIINDERLDWKELGLLAYLLSKPDNWEVCPVHLAAIRKTKRDGIYAILKALCALGYASKKPNPKGGWDWVITENPNTENPNTENTDTANNAESGKTRIRKNPHTEKPTQVNTDNKTKTDYLLNTEFSLSSENENLPKTELFTDSNFEPISEPEPKSELTNAQKIIMAIVKANNNREMSEYELSVLAWYGSGDRDGMFWLNLSAKKPERFVGDLNNPNLQQQFNKFQAKKNRVSGFNTNTGNFNEQNVGGNYATHSTGSATGNIYPITAGRKLSTAERQLASVQRAIERERWEKQQQGQQYEPDYERAVY